MTALPWQSLAIAFLTICGVGLCGIAAICLGSGARMESVSASSRTIGSGISAAFVGLLLLAAAFGARAL